MSGRTEDECGPYSIGRLLSHISKYTRSYLDRRLESSGIDGSSFGTLMYLFRNEGVTEKEISRHMLVDKATTTRTISKLESLGYVRREKDPDDRRAFRIFLTHMAFEKRNEMLKARNEWVDTVLKGLSKDEKKKLLELLHRMETNLRENREGGE